MQVMKINCLFLINWDHIAFNKENLTWNIDAKYFIEALMMSRQSSMLTALEGTFLKGITYPQAYVHMVVWILNVELMRQLIYKKH